MKRARCFNNLAICCTALFGVASPALHAQSIDAPRYVNAQGVEVIQGRRVAPPAPPAPAGPTAGDSEKPAPVQGSVAKSVSRSLDAAQARPAGYQIAAGEQQQRDRDRLAILNEEMRAENTALESKIRILQNPGMRAKLDPEQLKRLQETTLEHEKNIRALTSEISRARKSM